MTPPEGFDPSQMGGQFSGQMPGGMGGMTPPEGFDPSQMGGQFPGQMPGEQGGSSAAEGGRTQFYMQDKVNNFSGIANAK